MTIQGKISRNTCEISNKSLTQGKPEGSAREEVRRSTKIKKLKNAHNHKMTTVLISSGRHCLLVLFQNVPYDITKTIH